MISLVSLVVASAPGLAPAPRQHPHAGVVRAAGVDERISVGEHVFVHRQLANGLRAFAVHDAEAAASDDPRASIFVVLGAGNRDESAQTTGLAHLTEHALFTGTEATGDDEHDRIVQEELGGESNASTRDDYTIYYDHLIPADALARVLAMEADRMAHLAWDEEAVLHERERLRIEEAHTWNPSITRQELLEHAVYQREGYRWGRRDAEGHTRAPVLGVGPIRAFYEQHYRPERAAVVVVTPGAPEDALDAIEKAFAGWRAHEDAGPLAERPLEPKPFGPRVKRFPSGLAQDRVEFCWVVPPRGHPDAPALSVLARLLDRRQTPSGEPVQVAYHERQGSGLFRVAANGPEAARELAALMGALREEGPALDEVAAAVREEADRFTALPLRARPYFSLAAELGRFGVWGEHGLIADWSERVRALAAEDVHAALQTHLPASRRVLVHFTAADDPAAARELPSDTAALAKFAQDAGEAGEYQLAVAAYTELLARGPNKMNTVIYLATRGQLHMDVQDWEAAIADFEKALTVVDYPAVRDLLEEARRRQAEAGG